MPGDPDNHTKARPFQAFEQLREHRNKALPLETFVKIDGRINDPSELFRRLDQNGVCFQGIIAEREVFSMPLDQAKRHIHHGELSSGGFQLPRPHELHLDGWR